MLKKKGYITRALVGLISSGVLEEISDGKSKRKISQDVFKNIDIFSGEAHNKFVNIIKDNNGIKKRNQQNLMLPIGVDPESVDIVTFASLDSFGEKRGDIAHTAKISKLHTLSEIQGDLKTIVSGLHLYDKAACDALKTKMAI